MITKFSLDMAYEFLNSFQRLYAYIVDECLIEPLPQGIKSCIRDVEYPAAYDGLIYINFNKHPGKSIEEIVHIFRNLVAEDMDVRIFPEGTHPEEFAIVIDLRIPKTSRKWYYD